jgi:hypothetical protein
MGGLGGALGQVGQTLGAQSGLTRLGQGLASLFTGGDGTQAAAPDYTIQSPYAPPFQAAEGPAPGDLSLYVPEAAPPVAAPGGFVGPPSPYTAPNFLQGFYQGLSGTLGNPSGGADVPNVGGQIGGGLGELLAFLEQMKQRGGGQTLIAPVAQSLFGRHPATRIAPGYTQAAAPSGGLVHNLIGAATYGILGGGIPSSGQV